MKARLQQPIQQNKGESMIMVSIMLMVFFIIGASIMTASATTTATVSARISERQAYYYGRSMLDVLDDSMQEGHLGQAVCDKMMSRLVDSGLNAVSYKSDAPMTLTFEPTFSQAPLTSASLSPITITVTGKAESIDAVGLNIKQAALQLRTVDVDYTVTYQRQSCAMHIQYRGTCNVENYDAGANKGTWSKTWTIQQVG